MFSLLLRDGIVVRQRHGSIGGRYNAARRPPRVVLVGSLALVAWRLGVLVGNSTSRGDGGHVLP